MTSGPFLTPTGEDEWQRFSRHLAWCEHFALVFLFSDQPAVSAVFRERLAEIYRARVTRLEILVPKSPAALIDELLKRLLHPASYQLALNAPIWLDLTRGPVDRTQLDIWRDARLQFMARLNEQREPLRSALPRPLILVLFPADKATVRALCPDLWAIRHFTTDVGPWQATKPPVPERSETRFHPESFPLTDTETSIVMEWQRLRERDAVDRGALAAGGRAYDALMRRGRFDTARETATWLESVSHRLLERLGETPEALRDVSVSLDNVGDTDRGDIWGLTL